MSELVAIVAILKEEDSFVEEWIAYHRLMGVDQFILYDDDPRQHLRHIVSKYADFVTVFDWTSRFDERSGRNKQTRAYEHALNFVRCRWVAFIDCDEFIVLRKSRTLSRFLSDFVDADAVVLTWHMFGHNGFYQNPPGLITESLIRRQALPGNQVKSIVACERIIGIESAHFCQVRNPNRVFDANHSHFSRDNYPGKTENANINHYFCRSFVNWMARVSRGEVFYDPLSYPPREAWRFEERACLEKFVAISALHNEIVDDYMVQFARSIREFTATVKS